VTSRTFDKLAACHLNGVTPWVASFVLRMFSYDLIAASLACRGLGTEKFEGATFIQRRFRDEDEMAATLAAVRARDLRPAGKEEAGLLHAELFVSRPPEQVEALPINSMLSIASGANRRYGAAARWSPARARQAVPA